MEPVSAGLLALFILIVFLFMEVPIGLAMIMSSMIGLLIIKGLGPTMEIISFSIFSSSTNNVFSLIPLFVLMGWFAAESQLSADAFAILEKWMPPVRGALAMAVSWACAVFGAVCGSSMVSATTFVPIALPTMRKAGYHDMLSLGTIAGGANLAFIIPPSMGFIWYGIITQTSIASLFIAGIVPGVLCTLLFCITIYLMCRIDPKLVQFTRRKITWRERFKIPAGGVGIVILVVIVLGGIYAGICTPNEAGAVGAFGALIIGILFRRLGWRQIKFALVQSGKNTSFILLLLIGAFSLLPMVAASEIPQAASQWVIGLQINRWLILAAIIVLYLILGMFTDLIAFLIVTLPIFFPILVHLGYDPVWFGVIVVLTMCIGTLTPPVGVVVFVLAGVVKDVPISTIFKGAYPFFVTMIVLSIILILFPGIVTFLPNLMLQ